jgi:hypothetical protein
MQADPGQEKDISVEQKDVAERLSKAVAQWKEEVLPGLQNKDRPYTVGYPDFPITQLPARDGIAHGKIERSGHAPNCSFFKNWTSTNDSITWDVEVETPGKYEAVVYYTCPKTDTGSTIELSLNGSSIQGKVSKANDPPLMGAEHDRAPRKSGESLVKDFKPLRLGVVEFKQGRGLLTLRALAVKGKTVMDVRSVLLTLKTE